MQLNTSYFEKGEEILQRSLIIKNYMRNNIYYDLFSLIAFIIEWCDFELNSYVNILKLCILFQIHKIFVILKLFHEILELKKNMSAFLNLAILIIKNLLTMHIFACLWFSLTYINNDINQLTWLEDTNFKDSLWQTKYISSLYWTFVTMASLGYGDITPKNNLEKIFCIITIVVGSGFFAYSINQMGNIINQLNEKSNKIKDSLIDIKKFMNKKNFDKDLQLKINKYLEFRQFEETEKEEEIFKNYVEKLSVSLRKNFLSELYGRKIRNIEFLQKNFSEEFLQDVIYLIKKKQFGDQDLIISKDVIDSNFYYISKGKVEFQMQNSEKNIIIEKTLFQLNEGQSFGESSLFIDYLQPYFIKAIGYTSVYYIKKEEFVNLLMKKYPLDYEKYCMIKDKLQFSKDSSYLYTKCPSCQQENHNLLKECQLMNYKPNKLILIGKFNNWTPVIYRSLVTRRKNKISSLVNKNLIKETSEVFTKVFGDDYLINIEEDDEKSKTSSLTFDELEFQNGKDELNSLKLFNEENILYEKEYFKKVNTNDNIELENQKSQNSPLSSITRAKKNKEKNEICNINSETFGKLFYDFEIMKNYKNYFTMNNFEIIINKIRKKKKETEKFRARKQKSGKNKLFKNKVLINSRKI